MILLTLRERKKSFLVVFRKARGKAVKRWRRPSRKLAQVAVVNKINQLGSAVTLPEIKHYERSCV